MQQQYDNGDASSNPVVMPLTKTLPPSTSPTPIPKSEQSQNDLNVEIKSVDMNEEMQERAINLAKEAINCESSARKIAGYIKKEFDNQYGPVWHCVAGHSYGSFVTHETNFFIFFYVDKWAIMLFKTA